MKYSVVIPTYNHCNDLLKPCIESIINYTDLDQIELIISANGCTDNTKEYLESIKTFIPNFKVIWSDNPLGFPKATNLGIKEATCEKIVLLNNDCILLNQSKNDWLKILHLPFDENKNCGISCVIKSHFSEINYDFAIFFCVMIDSKLFNEIGYLNEEYGIGSGEDIEFSILAQKAGYDVCEVFEKQKNENKNAYTGKFPIFHKGEGTVHDKTLVSNWSENFLKNILLVKEKFMSEKKQNDKKIAVITPLYNDKKYIKNAIDCVNAQTIENIFHYIYDDASSDGSKEVLINELLKNPSIKFISEKENKGQSNARNVLIEKAINDGCEFIAFLDSDDQWKENHIEECLEQIKDNDIIYCKPNFKDENNNIVFPVNICIPEIFVGKQLLHNNFIWISSVFANIKCFQNNKFIDDLNGIEDWEMWISLYKQNYKFTTKQNSTVTYLVREGSQASKGIQKLPLLKQKHNILPKLKLHLACGHDYNEDYINVDFYAPEDAKCDVRFDVQKLPYPDNSVDEIKAFHIIEHFHFFEIKDVLNEWYRVLKPGGRLYLETPDFLETCKSFVEGSPTMGIEQWRILLYGHFFAHPWVPGQTHKFLFTENQLRVNLRWAGFKKINRLPPASKYVMNHTVHLFLNVEAFK